MFSAVQRLPPITKLTKKVSTPLLTSESSILAIAGYMAPSKISTVLLPLMKNPAADKVNVTINTTSVDTNHAERDKHLRSADFLNTAKYPQATFTSTSVKKDGDELDITGDLTLNGVTKPVTLEAKLIGQGDDPWGGKRAGFEAEGKIKLKDFNIKTDLGPASQEVDLIISVEGVQQK